jgi:hypothetical protein
MFFLCFGIYSVNRYVGESFIEQAGVLVFGWILGERKEKIAELEGRSVGGRAWHYR